MNNRTAKLPLHQLLQQGFIPILVSDGVDALLEVEACIAAGLNVIEFTLRRPDAREALPEIRRRYPNLTILVGSTLDSEAIVRRLRPKTPQLMTIDELVDIGVDGFVSMFDFTPGTLARLHQTHLMIPTASTVAEGLRLVENGAHCLKILGSYENTVRAMCSAPAFSFAPVFVTGGMTPDTMPKYAQFGAAVFAAGFDVMIQDKSATPTVESFAQDIRRFAAAALAARKQRYPQLDETLTEPDWINRLPWTFAEDL